VGGTRSFLYALFLLRIGQLPDLPPGINVLCYEVGRLFAGPSFISLDEARRIAEQFCPKARADGLAVCGFGATLTRDLYICCRNGLTESVPKRTVIWL
jgi:hypothetical protein